MYLEHLDIFRHNRYIRRIQRFQTKKKYLEIFRVFGSIQTNIQMNLEVFRYNGDIYKYLEHLDIFRKKKYIQGNLETLE